MSKNEKPVAPLDAKIETKTVKHTFSPAEREEMNQEMLSQFEQGRALESELQEVKSSYKAKMDSVDSRLVALTTALRCGFDMRPARCVVVFRPKDRKKDFYLESDWGVQKEPDADGNIPPMVPALTEDMTQDDFQQDLLRAEAAFDCKCEIELFPPTPTDSGVLVVGRMKDRWHSALRVKIGNRKLEERLDSEQKSVKERFDAIKIAVKRLNIWAGEQLGKEAAKGFADPINAAVEAQKERVE